VTTLALDTSAAIPLLLSAHTAHRLVRRRLGDRTAVLTTHSLAETYAVLSRLPGDARLTAQDAGTADRGALRAGHRPDRRRNAASSPHARGSRCHRGRGLRRIGRFGCGGWRRGPGHARWTRPRYVRRGGRPLRNLRLSILAAVRDRRDGRHPASSLSRKRRDWPAQSDSYRDNGRTRLPTQPIRTPLSHMLVRSRKPASSPITTLISEISRPAKPGPCGSSSESAR